MLQGFVARFSVSSGIRNPESGKKLESGNMGFGILNLSKKIRNPTNGWNAESKFYWRIQNPQRGSQNPRLSWIPLRGARPEEKV